MAYSFVAVPAPAHNAPTPGRQWQWSIGTAGGVPAPAPLRHPPGTTEHHVNGCIGEARLVDGG
ncbi:hypothetical protein [Paeniglutamicibacter sp. NPDC091659]|uniref:hypothetical protein n=1 Tax=Paeniglutamicibacter sp. NPDC091659 TaxID=3364389 RepID=UPI0038196BFA